MNTKIKLLTLAAFSCLVLSCSSIVAMNVKQAEAKACEWFQARNKSYDTVVLAQQFGRVAQGNGGKLTQAQFDAMINMFPATDIKPEATNKKKMQPSTNSAFDAVPKAQPSKAGLAPQKSQPHRPASQAAAATASQNEDESDEQDDELQEAKQLSRQEAKRKALMARNKRAQAASAAASQSEDENNEQDDELQTALKVSKQEEELRKARKNKLAAQAAAAAAAQREAKAQEEFQAQQLSKLERAEEEFRKKEQALKREQQELRRARNKIVARKANTSDEDASDTDDQEDSYVNVAPNRNGTLAQKSNPSRAAKRSGTPVNSDEVTAASAAPKARAQTPKSILKGHVDAPYGNCLPVPAEFKGRVEHLNSLPQQLDECAWLSLFNTWAMQQDGLFTAQAIEERAKTKMVLIPREKLVAQNVNGIEIAKRVPVTSFALGIDEMVIINQKLQLKDTCFVRYDGQNAVSAGVLTTTGLEEFIDQINSGNRTRAHLICQAGPIKPGSDDKVGHWVTIVYRHGKLFYLNSKNTELHKDSVAYKILADLIARLGL